MAADSLGSAPRLAAFAMLAAAGFLAAGPAPASTVTSCPFGTTTVDLVSRGIIIPNYAGANVRSIQLSYTSDLAGTFQITLRIRRAAFNGPQVGAAATVNVALPGGFNILTPVIFDFGGAPVTTGDTLTLTHTYTGPGNLYFDLGSTSCVGIVSETNGTSPPLDTHRGDSVGITVIQDDLTGGCLPSDTILCLDNNPGDRRFRLGLTFSHTGISPGTGQAASTTSLGITRGGAFWFFSQDNPEMLVKVLNGCGVNNNFWVFTTAGTNVAFTLNVFDTVSSQTKTYSNSDNNPAVPVQDTSAFSCNSVPLDITAFAGNWSGQWVNNTFGTNGPASMVVTVNTGTQIFQTIVTLGGNVLGSTAPPPQTLSGPYNASGVTINTPGTAFGNIQATISSSGAIVGSGTSVPNPNISRIDFTGTATTAVILVNYTITFSASAGGGTAVGVMTFNHN